jgi:NDP-sugar pyrophosphorylase family protein
MKKMKERVTLTLEKDVLHVVDSRVDGANIKNRSHAIELLLRKALRGTAPSVAIILAGGKGTRLRPITDKVPKPLIDVRGRPILDYNIELCKTYGITDIILSIGYMKEQIREHYKDGSRLGVKITYIEEDKPLGTAGPLRVIRDRLTDTFVLMNADELKDINLAKMFQVHLQNDASATIALTTVEDPSMYGVAVLDANKIMGFVEKPKKEQAPSKLISAGLYILEPQIIELIPDGFAMMESDVFPKLARQGVLCGYPFSGQWFDTGTPERLERARKLWHGFSH